MAQSLRERILQRHDDLIDVRRPRMADWIDLNDYILPRRLRYLHSEKRKGTRNTKIINSTATRAVKILESGMMSGMTNPARIWMRIVADAERMRISRNAAWCASATTKVLSTYKRSNVYKSLPKFYGMSAVFGTAAMYAEPDPIDVIRTYVLPTGQYTIDVDARGRVDTLYREFEMTARNLVARFGINNVTRRTRTAIERGKYNEPIVVVHGVEPRDIHSPDKIDARNMPWASYWLEKEALKSDGNRGLLREGGYKRFPFFVLRWDVTDDANDPYGDGPGIEAIGDAIGLQLLEKRKAQAVDKIVHPPMAGPSSVKPTNMSLVPNGFTAVDVMQGGQQFKPSVEINHAAPKSIGEEIVAHENRIKQIFFNDLWLMMSTSDRREITAREVDERSEEKMMQLGPVVERADDEVIDPLTEFTVAQLLDQGKLDPIPTELQGFPLQVDNISILAQAQKLVGTVGLERLAGFAGNIAAVNPRILDNIDSDALVRNYADMLGVDPSNLTDRERMEMLRQAAAEREQEAAMVEQAPALKAGADAAKVMSETDVQGSSALDRVLASVGAEGLQ